MPFLEILHYTGDVDRRPLDRRSPVSIGSHAINDIRIDEDNVETMHCRISWSKDHFEAVAAGVSPLDLNGTLVQRGPFKDGDVLRIGTVDIRFRDEDGDDESKSARRARPAESELLPVSDEINVRQEPAPRKPAPAAPQNPRPTSAPSAKKSASKKPDPTPEPEPDPFDLEEFDDEPDEELIVEPDGAAEGAATAGARDASDGLSERLRIALRSQQKRPGEEDPLRSPLVLGLAGVTAVLLLAGSVFYFMATRQTTQQEFDAAQDYYNQGNYRAAIEAFQSFTLTHPKHSLATAANRMLGQSRIRLHLDGASPDYENGLSQLREYVDREKDLGDFEAQHAEIAGFARTIALGAANAAGKQLKPTLLDVSRHARTIMQTYTPKDGRPTETVDQIEQALRASEALILKDDVFRSYVSRIQSSLQEKRPLEALKARRELLVRYPEFERQKQAADLLRRALAMEKDLSVAEALSLEAQRQDHESRPRGLTLAFQGRERTDEIPVGKTVLAFSQDCCYGVELATGQPLWRRAIGFDPPFFPLLEQSTPSAILFDTNTQELLRLHQATGELIWRQKIDEGVFGQPLLTGETLYISTRTGRLLVLDVASGEIVAQIKFSQPVTGPVEIDEQRSLVVAGAEETVYVISKRPFECVSVADIGHAAESVQAPLLSMARYLLLIENEVHQATLRLLKEGDGDQGISQVARGTTPGVVLDTPVVRGRDLFVPSQGERVSAFSLSDDPGQPPLTSGPRFQAESQRSGPIQLLTGPDRQLWMATGGLARLQLTTDSLHLDGEPVAAGIVTQPLQYLSGSMFHARRRLYTQGVTLTRTDRNTLTSDWQTILGSKILAISTGARGTGSLLAVNDAGQAFRIGDRQLEQGGFATAAVARLPLHPELADPLHATALAEGRVVVVCGGPEPRAWMMNAAGQTELSPQLPGPPQSAPLGLNGEVLVPLSGRIHVLRQPSRAAIQDFSLPTGEDRTWVNVAAAGENTAVAVTTDGLLLLLRIQEAPRAHLGEAARYDFAKPVRFPVVSSEGFAAVVHGDRSIALLETDRFEPRGERTFDAPISGAPRFLGSLLFVEEDRARVACLDPANDLSIRWSVEINQTGLAGVASDQDHTVLVCQNGDVLRVTADGEVVNRLAVGAALIQGPIEFGGRLYVSTLDGTLIRLPPWN